ncbi:MAG: hypothetical protein ACREKI_03225, partial [Gemmatimonadota bacterium]
LNPDALREGGAISRILTARISFPKAWRLSRYHHEKVIKARIAAEKRYRRDREEDAGHNRDHAGAARGLTTAQAAQRAAARHLRNLESIQLKASRLYTRRLEEVSSYESVRRPITRRVKGVLRQLSDGIASKVLPARQAKSVKALSEVLLGATPQGAESTSDATVRSAQPVVVDREFLARLHERLTEDERETFQKRAEAVALAGPLPFEIFWTFIDEAKEETCESSPSLCDSVQVFEGEQPLSTTHAAPTEVTDQNRPSIRALGFGDLIVARERLVRYDAREIAHIENVLPGEDRLREHERTTRREEVVETERREETRSERDLQTTDRYELQTESQRTINEQFAIEAGLNVSAKYGMATLEASLEAGCTRSTSEAQSAASTTAKEVVSKAVESTYESVREQRRLTLTEQIRELNRHGINNTLKMRQQVRVSPVGFGVRGTAQVRRGRRGGQKSGRCHTEIGAPDTRIAVPEEPVLTPRDRDLDPGTWTGGHRPRPSWHGARPRQGEEGGLPGCPRAPESEVPASHEMKRKSRRLAQRPTSLVGVKVDEVAATQPGHRPRPDRHGTLGEHNAFSSSRAPIATPGRSSSGKPRTPGDPG